MRTDTEMRVFREMFYEVVGNSTLQVMAPEPSKVEPNPHYRPDVANWTVEDLDEYQRNGTVRGEKVKPLPEWDGVDRSLAEDGQVCGFRVGGWEMGDDG